MGDPSRGAELIPALRAAAATAASPPDRVMSLFAAATVALQLDTSAAELAAEAIALGRSCRWQTGEAFGLVARAMTTDSSQPNAQLRACEEALELAVRAGCQEVEGVALTQMMVPMLEQQTAIATAHARRTLDFWSERGNWINFRTTVEIIVALLADAGAQRDALIALGHLGDFSGMGTSAVRHRLETAANLARAAIADHQALLRQGSSMTNHEIHEYLIAALDDLEHGRN